MTAMAQNSELMLFITHVETDGPLLKIWGQVDRNAATCVERMILPLTEKFTQGLGLPNPSFPLPLNMICCARFQNEGYYRAKICGIQPSGNVLVHFLDYGNFEVLPPTAIRLLDNIPSVVSLHTLAPLALDFILANVLPVGGIWEPETVESIKQTLRYADLKGMLHSVIGSHRMLKLCYNNEDFGDLLVSKNLAVSVSLQDMFSSRRQTPQQNRPQIHQQQYNRDNIPAYSSPRINQSHNNSVGVQEDWRNSQQRQPPPPHVPEALVFKTRVLDVGSVHDVFVSYVEDGPLKFAIQVQSTSEILKQLMNEINNYPTAPLQEPPLPGSVCLGRYSQDKVLCRAVVMAVMEQKCKLYYVDFGHTEVLSYSDIFQLPPQYINPRVLSIRFTLSGLKDMVITEETKEYFKKIVSGKALVLQVRPPEGPPLIQYGDLYENRINIRDLLRENSGAVFYQEPLRLKRGAKEIVHVSFVESCNKFFVQLDSGVKSLNSVMACLAEYAKGAPQLEEKSLQVGCPCCASYGEDKQWYRAQILSIKGDQVTVLYVDYGNEETVGASSLRQIHTNLVTNLRSQAIKCALNGFQSSQFNQEIANQFELIVLEKKLAMEVVDALPQVSIVELFDCGVVPMASIALQLQISHPATRGGGSLNSSMNLQKEEEQVLNSSRSPDGKHHQGDDRSSKWARNSKPNTWGQESRAGDWNPRARSNNHEGREQLEEKSRTKIVKDVENEQRQRENNRHDGEDRLHQKETRNNHFNRNDNGGNRFERNEDTGSRRARGNRFGSGSRISREDNRFDKNINKEDNYSDRDSDTSSRSSGKRGSKGPRGIKGRTERGGRRGGDRRTNSGKWSDGESDRSSQKSNQSTGFRSKERNSSNPSWKNSKTQPTKTGTWNSMSPTSPVKESPRLQKPRIPPPNITVGAIKTSEVIYTLSPTDFYVQLCPDNLELDTLMEKISQKYSNGGTIIRKSEIQPGTSCIAQYSVDSTWYRATINTNDGDSASVHFIDYGNTETVGHDKIKELQPEFAKLSAQAVHCKLFAAAKSSWSDTEIDEFAQTAEGISLEAEFLSQDNGAYEVLLRTVADNASGNDYVNKLFCGNTDLEQAKRDLKNKARGGGGGGGSRSGTKKTHQILQCIPAGQKWSDEVFSAGFQVDVVVTWFFNPNNFYCQILNKQSEFRTMMNNIQESYGEQLPIRNTLQVGDPVIAFFSDDGALYRAEIKELNKLRGHIVQYVDFGNCAMVDPCKIYPVEKRFSLLPKQAMHCSLRNVSPATGVDWSNANKHQIDKYFDADKYLCTFHGTKDGKYLISLNNRGKDIGEDMIRAGLAANPEIRKEVIVDKVTAADKNQTTKETEKQDLTLWNGQMIRTIVIKVQGAGKFYIQLPMDSEKDHLVECYLYNITPTTQIDEILKKTMEGKDAIVDIKDVNNQRFAVDLYDVAGKNIKLVESDPDVIVSPVCPLPISAGTTEVWITHIENSENIWLQRSLDSENIAGLLSSLYEYYSVSGTPLSPEVGKLCVAESSDNNWYRAKIETLKESEAAEVRFIDYGNTEEVPTAGMKILEERFYTPHEMALRVSLVVSLKGTDEEQRTILQENLSDKELTATFYNVDNKWLVELTENDKKMSEKFLELNLVAEFKEKEPQKQQEIAEMIVGNRYKVYLSHSDSPAQFWLQRNEEIDAIEEMQASLQILAPDFPPLEGIPEEGTLCAALYSADSMWYRAEVLDADEDITTVRFIDYGNTDVVNSNSTSIKDLPQSWKGVKKYGLKSRLDLIPTGAEDWSSASCEMFEKLATDSTDPITALIIADSVPRRVELFVEGENSIGDSLVKEGHAIMVHNAEDLIDEIIDLELDPRSAFVSHINSPSEFWVQEEKSVSDLEMMTDRFIVVEMFPKLEEIVEGCLCVAKFPDDDQWYRARVKSHSSSGTEVLYIDYGNSAVSTEVRTIPEDLAAVAPLSRKCSLELPPGVEYWSDKACDKFIDLAADGATIFLLDVIKEGETSVVSLNLDGVNVADQLTKLCDLALPVIDERLPPLGEENSPYIFVSHVNSPDEFWTQAESSINELETMASRLIDAQSLLPLNTFEQGTICAAKFPEDEAWYRARILSHGEAGTNVLYFDYGSSALATELRILPEDVANIPSLAMRCRLLRPNDVESWSAEAAEKFNEIVADGATMFQFEILDNNDPTLIALQLEGTNVVELLKPLCTLKNLEGEIEEEIVETSESQIVDTAVEDQKESKIDETVQEADVSKAENTGINLSDEVEKPQTVNSDVVEEEAAPVNGTDEKSETKEAEADEVHISEAAQTSTDISDVVTKADGEEASLDDKLVPKMEITEEISEPCESGKTVKLEEPAVDIPAVILPKVENGEEEPETVAAIEENNVVVEVKKEPEELAELTVDDIVGNMVKVALVDGADMTKIGEQIPEEELNLDKTVGELKKPEVPAQERIEDLETGTPQETPEINNIVPASISGGSVEEDIPLKLNQNETVIGDSGKPEEPVQGGIKDLDISTPQETFKIDQIITGSIPKGSMEEDIQSELNLIENVVGDSEKSEEPAQNGIKDSEISMPQETPKIDIILPASDSEASIKEDIPSQLKLDKTIVGDSEKPEEAVQKGIRDLEISMPQETPKIDKILPASDSEASIKEDIPSQLKLDKTIVDDSEKPEEAVQKGIRDLEISMPQETPKIDKILPASDSEASIKEDIPSQLKLDKTFVGDSEKPEEAVQKGIRDSETSTPQKTAKIDKIVPGSISRGSIEDDIPSEMNLLVRRRSSCSDERIVPGGINKGNDLSEVEIVDLVSPEKISATEKSDGKEEASIAALRTPAKINREDKILPGSISRGESPTVELNRPSTPKTPHSEKLLAGVVNLQETLSEFEEQDEILTVEVENNIPNNGSA